MRIAPSLFLLVIAALCVGSVACTKEEDDEGYRAASLVFTRDSGYTFTNDTLAAGDTVHVGLTVDEGSERLHRLTVDVRYNGGTAHRFDSVLLSDLPFTYDKLLPLRAVPGTENWIFAAEEGGGDRTLINLVLTVE